MKRHGVIAILLASALVASGPFALAQTQGTPDEAGPDVPEVILPDVIVPYDASLRRLATVLGSLHYLRNLCGDTGNQWRAQMESLIVADEATGERRERLIAAFNNGYRAFAANHVQCTPVALRASERFTAEGARLTEDILTRFKN